MTGPGSVGPAVVRPFPAGPAFIGIVVGMHFEARIARRLARGTRGVRIGIGGGTRAGAQLATEALVERGARALISFGLCGGLDPALAPGALLVPRAVVSGGRVWPADPVLAAALGGMDEATVFGGAGVLATPEAKRAVWTQTGSAAVDLESGAVATVAARHGLPFAALRAVCDPADQALPPAATEALDGKGRVRIGAVLAGLARRPWTLGRMLDLGRESKAARRALQARVQQIGRLPEPLA